MSYEDREERVERYYGDSSALELAEKLVDAEDEIEVWKAKALSYAARLAARLLGGS